MKGLSMNDVISLEDLIKSIPFGFEKDPKVIEEVTECYATEMYVINGYVKQIKENKGKPFVFFPSFNRNGLTQFEVKNLGEPIKDMYNWHGQNTSQWVYAGAIYVDKNGHVSTHH
jgi:hypothetical protein